MPRLRWPILFAILSPFASSAPALAQATGDQVAAAQALFDDGKRLMQEGHYDEGCPKLVESQRLDPGGGTLLAIGLCHEAQGKPATAWGDFSTALGEARKDRRADRESAALEHLRALEEKMPRARILVATRVDGLEIHRDGALVGVAQWGTPLPLDPGVHRFEAHAPGKRAWAMDVTVPAEARMVDVTIPELKDAPELAAPVAPAPPPPPAPAPAPPPARSALRTWGLVTGGGALAFVGVGAGLGLSASSKWNSAKSTCTGDRCTDPNAASLGVSAGNAADVSTVFFTVGGVGVVASVVLLVLSATESPSAARTGVSVTPLVGAVNGLAIGGTL
jgi:hypothetical protein